MFPDGRMETVWRIRDGAVWHDGASFTVDDLLFTRAVGRDREVAILNHPAWALIDDVTAIDDRTISAHWKEPYIYGDAVFSYGSSCRSPGTSSSLDISRARPTFHG